MCRLSLSSLPKGCGRMHFLSPMTNAQNNLEIISTEFFFNILLITWTYSCYVTSPSYRCKSSISLLSNADRPVQTNPELPQSNTSNQCVPCLHQVSVSQKPFSKTAQATSRPAGNNPQSTRPSVVFAT